MITLWSVWVLMPQGSDGVTILAKSNVFRMRCKTEALLSVVIKNPMTLLVKSRGVTPVVLGAIHSFAPICAPMGLLV